MSPLSYWQLSFVQNFHFDTPRSGGGEETVMSKLQIFSSDFIIRRCLSFFQHIENFLNVSFRKCDLLNSYQAEGFVSKKTVVFFFWFSLFLFGDMEIPLQRALVHFNSGKNTSYLHRKSSIQSGTLKIESSSCFLSFSSSYRGREGCFLSYLNWTFTAPHHFPDIFQIKIF